MSDGADAVEFGKRLLAWYEGAARRLPWREPDPDAYRVWVSEAMLQQTGAATVVPYYRRWLERFPDLASLAAAEQQEVLRLWEGLGYYSRARNLHAAARIVRERYAGRLPDDPAALRALPGVGTYTAGAIASIAFGRDVPAVDANARRVICRVHDLARPTDAELRRLAAAWLVPGRAGDVNQALMDLGASLCTPRAPRCAECPLGGVCGARSAGTVARRPEPRRRPRVPERWHVAAVVVHGAGARDREARVLLRRRPTAGMFGGMWEFPQEEVAPASATRAAALRVAEASGVPPRALGGDPAGTVHRVRQSYSHFTGVYEAYPLGAVDAPAPERRAHRWVPIVELSALPMPRAQRRISALCLPEAARGRPPGASARPPAPAP